MRSGERGGDFGGRECPQLLRLKRACRLSGLLAIRIVGSSPTCSEQLAFEGLPKLSQQ